MDPNQPEVVKTGRTFDSAYSFSFSIAVGLVLFIAGLVISLTFGQSATIGLIFGIPLLIAGLVLPLFMLRDLFHHNEINSTCPYCEARDRSAGNDFAARRITRLSQKPIDISSRVK
jgi:hypothetical protein